MSITAFVAMGSNLGDRTATLLAALEGLRTLPGISVVATSRFWETDPIGGPPDQGKYLNAVTQLDVTLTSRQLFAVLQGLETRHGRLRAEAWGPRTLDLDLLYFGDQVVRENDLQVPHQRLHERSFVLGPLAELAPTLLHPILQRNTVEMLADLARGDNPPAVGDLQDLRVVVTGSSSGIGRATALLFAQRGAHVLVHARRSQQVEEVVTGIRRYRRESGLVLADFTEPDVVTRFAADAWSQYGPVDVWVNNAGADTLTGASAQLSFAEKLQLLWSVDVQATIALSRDVGARMRQRGKGVIINIGWDQAETGMEGDSGQLFAASKGAVMAFTKSLAVGLAPQVRVNCVAPGWIKTAWGEGASEAWQERACREAPLGRWGTPADVAAACCWLASPAAAFVTGQIIRVNGGAVR